VASTVHSKNDELPEGAAMLVALRRAMTQV
jgi:hypothetical protein